MTDQEIRKLEVYIEKTERREQRKARNRTLRKLSKKEN